MNEAETILLAQAGDIVAFQALVEAYQRKVYHVCYGLLKDEASALRIAQDTFVAAHRYIERFDSGTAFWAWLYRIAVNLSIDTLRSRPVTIH